jgi:hypothetical protein
LALKSEILRGIPEMAISLLKHDLITAICETAAWGRILGGEGSKYQSTRALMHRNTKNPKPLEIARATILKLS